MKVYDLLVYIEFIHYWQKKKKIIYMKWKLQVEYQKSFLLLLKSTWLVNYFPAPFKVKHALVTPGGQVWKWCFPSVDLVLKIAISILDLLFPLLPVLYPPKLVLLQLCRWWQFPTWCCNTVEGNFFFLIIGIFYSATSNFCKFFNVLVFEVMHYKYITKWLISKIFIWCFVNRFCIPK